MLCLLYSGCRKCLKRRVNACVRWAANAGKTLVIGYTAQRVDVTSRRKENIAAIAADVVYASRAKKSCRQPNILLILSLAGPTYE